jgi:hypothetical protein
MLTRLLKMSDGMDIDGDVAPQAIVQAEPSLLSGPAMAGPQQAGTSMSLLGHPLSPEGIHVSLTACCA